MDKIEKYSDLRKFQLDKKELDPFDITDEELLKTLDFNSDTKFVDRTIADKIMEEAKEPPLGIKDLHKMGLTGKGVNVAIIDQPLALNHPEYKEKVVEYKVFGPEKLMKEQVSSMHGPAVASLLVGENIGVAPDAKLFYAANPSWLKDAQYDAQGLLWILEINKKLPESEKIKFVSVSARPSGPYSPREKNKEMWDKAVKLAEESGVVVVDCTDTYGFVYPGYLDYKTGEFKKGFPNDEIVETITGKVFVPTSLRTIAESFDDKTFNYTYNGVGGLSWGIPYAVGLLCLGQQLAPNLTAKELKKCFIESAIDNVVNPKGFIEMVKEMSEEKSSVIE